MKGSGKSSCQLGKQGIEVQLRRSVKDQLYSMLTQIQLVQGKIRENPSLDDKDCNYY